MKLPSLFRRRQPGFARSAARHACRIEGEVLLTDSQVSYEGRITDLSIGGAMFRPRLAYLLYRRNEPMLLQVGGVDIAGEIAGTFPAGFGLRFAKPLNDVEMAAVLALSLAGEAADTQAA